MTKQPPRVHFDFAPAEVSKITGEEDPNFIYSDDEEVQYDSVERIPKVVEKVKPTDDIFEDIPNKIIADLEAKINSAKPTAKTKKPVDPNKPKRKVDPEHMAKMRAAAAATRARKKKERDDEKKLDLESKELINKKKKMEIEKMKKELDGDPVLPPDPLPTQRPEPEAEPEPEQAYVPPAQAKLVRQNTSTFTQEDLSKIQFDAIARYEVLRKDRKLKKREEQKLAHEKEELMRTLTGMRKPQQRSHNIYDGCY